MKANHLDTHTTITLSDYVPPDLPERDKILNEAIAIIRRAFPEAGIFLMADINGNTSSMTNMDMLEVVPRVAAHFAESRERLEGDRSATHN
jgi:hypothetical protein